MTTPALEFSKQLVIAYWEQELQNDRGSTGEALMMLMQARKAKPEQLKNHFIAIKELLEEAIQQAKEMENKK